MSSDYDPLHGLSIADCDADSTTRAAAELFAHLDLQVQEIARTNLEILEKEESWGLLHRMYEKAAAHTAACIVLLSNRHFASAEALCRTAIEASVNLCYCSPNDSVDRILTYFKSHIAEERRQNRLWSESIKARAVPRAESDEYSRGIRQKEEALRNYERIITQTFAQIGHSYALVSDKWPSTYDRFRALNKEIEYRTIYTALCSQTHNDAEDLINEFVHGTSQVPGAHEAQERENQNFARVMVLAALRFLVESAAIYLAKYPIDSNTAMLPLLKQAISISEEAACAHHR